MKRTVNNRIVTNGTYWSGFQWKGNVSFVFTLFFCLLASTVWTQVGRLSPKDSLRATRLIGHISTMKESPAKVDSILSLSGAYYNTSQSKVLSYCLAAVSMSQKIGYHAGTENALLKSTLSLSNLGKTDSMLLFIDKYFAHIPNVSDSQKIVNGYGYIGGLLKSIEHDQRAFHVLTTAAEIADRNDYTQLALYQYNRLSNLVITSDIPAAITYMEKAHQLAKQLDNANFIGRTAINLSILHDDLDVIENYLAIAQKAAEKAENPVLLSAVYNMQAEISEDNNEAIRLKEKSLEYLDNKVDGQQNVAGRYHSLAELYNKAGRYEDTKKAINRSLKYYRNQPASWGYADGLKLYAQAAHGLDNTKEAFDSLQMAYQQIVKYYDNLREQNLDEVNKKYTVEKVEKELAQKELRLATEESKRYRQLLIALSIFGLGILGTLLYLNTIKKRRRDMEHALHVQRVEAQSLQELDEMKSRWFENISHDIRTPLTLISAPIKDALTLTNTSQVKKLLDIADRNSQHLLKLTNEMLELAKLENTTVPIHNKSTYLRTEIEKMIGAFDSFAADRDVNIETGIHVEESMIASLDYDKFEKIFNNLFKNAIQYSPSNTTVMVNASIEKNFVQVAITDQGAGIPANQLPHLFDKYFRASDHQEKRIEGSGLGLAIVHELIEILGGNISVDSTVGQGTTFTFKVPFTNQSVSDHTEFHHDESQDQSTGIPALMADQYTILLVEDNVEMMNYLADTLGRRFGIEKAENANVALQLLAGRTFDLILSDIMMPGMDGFTFKKRVNALSTHQHTPFIFLSAKALDTDKLEGLRLGIDDYITKPFVTEELIIRIKNLLSRKDVRQAELKQDPQPAESKETSTIVDNAWQIINREIQNSNLDVDMLSSALALSSTQLTRRLKKEAGLTTVQFILEVRLQKARELLLSKEVYSVKEVQHQVGILSQSYFSRKFTERFGVSPGSML